MTRFAKFLQTFKTLPITSQPSEHSWKNLPTGMTPFITYYLQAKLHKENKATRVGVGIGLGLDTGTLSFEFPKLSFSCVNMSIISLNSCHHRIVMRFKCTYAKTLCKL